jgi:hypothetical protein
MKYRPLALLLASIIVGGTTIQAYVTTLNQKGANNRWFLSQPSALLPGNSVNRATKAIRIYFQNDAFSEANRDAELNAVRSAFGQWQSIPGTSLKFEEAGLLLGEVDINTNDATNLVYWAKTSTLVNNETTDIRGRLGVTFKSGFIDVPLIAESDIVFNGVDSDWYTDFTSKLDPRQFIEGVAIHEIGHLIGLAHSTIGAATMIFDSGGSGIGTVVGLSKDDLAYADHSYGSAAVIATKGSVEGVISREGVPVYGASIMLEDQSGAIVTGGISRQESPDGPDGHYIINGVPPGDYHLRVHPLQDPNAPDWLVIPGVIPLANGDQVDTQFLPSDNMPITITAGQTSKLDVAVETGQEPFVITGIRSPTTDGFEFTLARSGVAIQQGAQEYVIGIYGPDLPTEGASLSITGPGITISPSEVKSDLFPNLIHIFAIVNIADDAVPGLRSLVLRKGNDVAYATGYFEILPKSLDYNFDGLDDDYQRQHFDLFTSEDAAPGADPDSDGFTNAEESTLNSNPTDPLSIPVEAVVVEPFEVLSVSLDVTGSKVTFASVAGATYQLFSRQDLSSGNWEPIGDAIEATAETTEILDPSATEDFEFYQVQTLP